METIVSPTLSVPAANQDVRDGPLQFTYETKRTFGNTISFFAVDLDEEPDEGLITP